MTVEGMLSVIGAVVLVIGLLWRMLVNLRDDLKGQIEKVQSTLEQGLEKKVDLTSCEQQRETLESNIERVDKDFKHHSHKNGAVIIEV